MYKSLMLINARPVASLSGKVDIIYNPATREPFRSVNFLSDIALESVVGQGAAGYLLGLESIARRVAAGELPR